MRLLTEVIETISSNSSERDGDASTLMHRELHKILTEMMDRSGDMDGAMVSSVDGIAWAEALREDLDKHRFAAMSSALLALSDTLVSEGQKGRTQNVLIEGENGNVFVMHAGADLLLTVFTKGKSNLGISLAYAKQAAEAISCLSAALG